MTPHVEIDPSMRFGRPHIRGIPVDSIGGMLAAGESVATVADEYGMTRGEVLVACWYLGLYGTRRWKRLLRDWANPAGEQMWHCNTVNYDDVPDPPLGDDGIPVKGA